MSGPLPGQRTLLLGSAEWITCVLATWYGESRQLSTFVLTSVSGILKTVLEAAKAQLIEVPDPIVDASKALTDLSETLNRLSVTAIDFLLVEGSLHSTVENFDNLRKKIPFLRRTRLIIGVTPSRFTPDELRERASQDATSLFTASYGLTSTDAGHRTAPSPTSELPPPTRPTKGSLPVSPILSEAQDLSALLTRKGLPIWAVSLSGGTFSCSLGFRTLLGLPEDQDLPLSALFDRALPCDRPVLRDLLRPHHDHRLTIVRFYPDRRVVMVPLPVGPEEVAGVATTLDDDETLPYFWHIDEGEDGALLLSTHGVIHELNQMARRLLGDAARQGCLFLDSPELFPADVPALRAYLENAALQSSEASVRRIEGCLFRVLISHTDHPPSLRWIRLRVARVLLPGEVLLATLQDSTASQFATLSLRLQRDLATIVSDEDEDDARPRKWWHRLLDCFVDSLPGVDSGAMYLLEDGTLRRKSDRGLPAPFLEALDFSLSSMPIRDAAFFVQGQYICCHGPPPCAWMDFLNRLPQPTIVAPLSQDIEDDGQYEGCALRSALSPALPVPRTPACTDLREALAIGQQHSVNRVFSTPLIDRSSDVVSFQGFLVFASHSPQPIPFQSCDLARRLSSDLAKMVRVRLAHATIVENEAKLQQLFANVSDMMCFTNGSSKIMHVNAAFVRATKRSEAELLNQPFESIVHPDPQQSLISPLFGHTRCANHPSLLLLRTKEGKDIPVSMTSCPVFWKSITMTCFFLRDASAVVERQDIFLAALNSSNDAIAVWEHDWTLIFWNRRFEEMWRIDGRWLREGSRLRSQRISWMCDQLQDPSSFLSMLTASETQVTVIIPSSCDLIFPEQQLLNFKDGRRFELRKRHFETRQTDQSGAVLCFTDLTDRVRVEELDRIHRELNRALATKNEFLAKISHEVRTPLNGISGAIQLAWLEREILPPQIRDLLGVINTSAAHLISIVNDLIDLSSLELGRLRINPVDFRLRQCIAGAIKIVEPLLLGAPPIVLPEKAPSLHEPPGVELRTDISPAIPSLVRGDEGRLRQILVNLLHNAVKFTEVGTITLRVDLLHRSSALKLRATEEQTPQPSMQATQHLAPPATLPWFTPNEPPSESVVAEPHEQGKTRALGRPLTGARLDADRIPHLFDLFTSTAPPQQQRRGSGLGLPIVRQLVRLFDGDIHVASEVGVGSTFTFTILLEALPEESPRTEDSSSTTTAKTPSPIGASPIAQSPSSVGPSSEEAPRVFASKYPLKVGFSIMILKSLSCVISCPSSRERQILAVEDEPVNRLILERFLIRLGYSNMTLVEDGMSAVEAFQMTFYDVVLMDIQMPRMNGLAATQKILESIRPGQRRPWIVAMTAGVLLTEREHCFEAGMNAFVGKPFQLKELEKALIDGWAYSHSPSISVPAAPSQPI
ncbi:putative PAS domain S-box protein [Paratrimastix pyriformis]|uniref:histidine kinase n=1 Tax=Paratrimastix pyriformis TaxID=342808 RepID=A0ABQ8UPQ7_9EUKA|nr:putative PAS domain S-box protein [Paratrimastix pyriformis]